MPRKQIVKNLMCNYEATFQRHDIVINEDALVAFL